MNDERDELIERASLALRPLPRVNAMATARIVAAVRARRAQRPSALRLVLDGLSGRSLSLASAGALAAAALPVAPATRGAEVPARPAADVAGVVRAVPVPIVFSAAPNATRVSVVGDFNSWDAAAAPMRRVGKDGPWTATVLARPGRHVYAFLVDGAPPVADPPAPPAPGL